MQSSPAHSSGPCFLDWLCEERPLSLMDSIKKNLEHILNTRKNTAPDKNYGLLDLNLIYQNLPDSIQDLAQELKNMVEKYEPRLKQIAIRFIDEKSENFILHFIISGVLENNQGKKENLELDTYFCPGPSVFLGG
ncbi:MAG: type VI secretion system baseplate subunit TssE [Gammaproteobacteria bacterium]